MKIQVENIFMLDWLNELHYICWFSLLKHFEYSVAEVRRDTAFSVAAFAAALWYLLIWLINV